MSEVTESPVAIGMVAYADGSFRRGLAGWGIHAYIYTNGPLKEARGEKQLPTPTGYKTIKLDEACGVLQYIDTYGTCKVSRKTTNNVAELQAVIESFKLARKADVQKLLIYTDSEYVQKNLYNSLDKWASSNWTRPDGNPVKNQELWQELKKAKEDWLKEGRNLDVAWIKGHSGDRGNDGADLNALLSTVHPTKPKVASYDDIVQANKLPEVNPLLMRSRLLFDAHSEPEIDGIYYCMYSLGTAHNYGHKQHDSTLEKIAKTDIILGRKLSDACYAIAKLPERDDYVESLKANHRREHPVPYSQPAVLRLDNVFTPVVRKRYAEIGDISLANIKSISATTRFDFVPISKTLNPPRQTYEAIRLFSVLKDQLDNYLNGTLGKSVHVIDITDQLYAVHQEGKKKPVNKLLADITNATPCIDVKAEVKGVAVKLRLVLGLDIPVRNTLAKLAAHEPKVSVLVVANGPQSYSFNTILDTGLGTLIYSCPYTQFVLPLK